MSTEIQILDKAIEKIADPAKWGKGVRGNEPGKDRPLDTCCAAEALEDAEKEHGRGNLVRVLKIVYCAAGLEWRYDAITNWNDAPERTHAEVIAALRLARAIFRMR
jgi:hypothetical protein